MPSDQGFVSAPHRQKSHEMRQADSRGSEGVEGMSVPAVLRRATSNGQVSVTLPTDPRLRRGQNLNSEWVTTQGGLSLGDSGGLTDSRRSLNNDTPAWRSECNLEPVVFGGSDEGIGRDAGHLENILDTHWSHSWKDSDLLK